MDQVILARIQFASTTLFHYIFVPMTIGLAFLIAILETLYVLKGKEIYKQSAKFWSKLFLINFAVGVVTGILQEFQFGMNWSNYSRFVGDVFGPSLAIEGLLAFFMESTFIGLWVFGWDRLSKRVHLACIWLVSIGTVLSAFWILTANSFMHAPVGYVFQNGRAEMSDFFAIITNPQLWLQFPHTLFAAFATGAFFMAGVSAWKLLKRHNPEMFQKSFHVSITVAIISALLVAVIGHQQSQHLLASQPMKMAAAEALWNTSEDPAPFTLYANIDTEKKENSAEIKIPYMLSILSFNKLSGSLDGMNQIQAQYEQKYGPGNYIPSVKMTFWSFRTMVIAGGLMCLLGIYGLVLARRRKLEQRPWFLKLMVGAIAFPFLANSAGWLMAEMGRQPWVVFGVMRTEDAISPTVTAGELLFSLIAFTSIYAILAIIDACLFVKVIRKDGEAEEAEASILYDPFDKEEAHALAK
ncbi:cytochrome ubiquinol oxidase subunit I [Paenibacillus apiarius]|uniref:cytochrome ubiquinol oxidase subunit I n=1 Tax=Paenibacillus apiarius TaxID=46240 RepID=UPI001980538A|nr:cytochrome ubiquinol oxidase subunit I [Paenibacillus apiarius]MBN3524218.1 cytochrome ubiquinol oxidase subunit I [Paenibacillus apiarius]